MRFRWNIRWSYRWHIRRSCRCRRNIRRSYRWNITRKFRGRQRRLVRRSYRWNIRRRCRWNIRRGNGRSTSRKYFLPRLQIQWIPIEVFAGFVTILMTTPRVRPYPAPPDLAFVCHDFACLIVATGGVKWLDVGLWVSQS